jgi:membrane protease YdiL (CAAX protease family)
MEQPFGAPPAPALPPQGPIAPGSGLRPPEPDEPRRLKPWQAWLFTLIGCVGALVVSTAAAIVAGIIVMVVTGEMGTTPQEMEALLATPAVFITSIVATGAMLIGAALLAPIIVRAPIRETLGLRGAHPLAFVAGVIGTLGLAPLGDVLVTAFAKIAPDLTFGNLELITEFVESIPFAAAWPLIALSPGISEELFFRGMLQRGLGNRTKAVVLAGLAFAFFHMDPHHVVGVIPIGLYLGFVAARSGSTIVAMVCHIANNTAALLQSHLTWLEVGHGTDAPMPWWLPVTGLLVAAAATALLLAVTRKKPALPPAVSAAAG